MTVRTRFAPSPTGYLHIGGLRTALYAYLYAKQRGGRFILRIEDTDLERYVDGAVEIIYRTLKEAGLRYDEGPDVGGDYAPYVQSQRKGMYAEYAHKLVELGGAYYCFCSKQRLAKLHEGGATKYDKCCLAVPLEQARKRIADGESYVVRQNIPEKGVSSYTDLVFGEISVDHADLEDNILLKSDGMPTYNFANVVDDHLMGITHIIRGTEYLSSTPKYNLLYKAFGWDVPSYIHLQPIMKDANRKLSKRHGDASYEDFVARGFLKEAIINYIALLGWSSKHNQEKFTLDELVQEFSLDGVSKSASIFDENKMRWLNSLYVKELTLEQFHAHALPFYKHAAKTPFDVLVASRLLHSRVEVFEDIPKHLAFLDEFDSFDLETFVHAKQKVSLELAREILPKLIAILKRVPLDSVGSEIALLNQECGYKVGQTMWVMRIAIAGARVTPGGANEMAELVGREEAILRMEKSLARLEQ